MKPRLVKFTCPASNRSFEFVSLPAGSTDAEVERFFVTWLKDRTKANWADEITVPDMKRAASGEQEDYE